MMFRRETKADVSAFREEEPKSAVLSGRVTDTQRAIRS